MGGHLDSYISKKGGHLDRKISKKGEPPLQLIYLWLFVCNVAQKLGSKRRRLFLRDTAHSFEAPLIHYRQGSLALWAQLSAAPRQWHDSFTSVTWLIRMCDTTRSQVTWRIHMCGMTHSYVWHDSFTCATWLIHMCDMTHSRWFTCLTWLIHISEMTHSHVWHD